MRPIVLRNAMAEDMPMVREFHRRQNERDGTSYPLPHFFRKNGTKTDAVPVALVGVREGELVGSIYIERRAELMFAGCDPRMTAFARKDINALISLLSLLGYGGIHCDVPLNVLAGVSPPLETAGFRRNDDRLAHFFMEVPPNV